MRSKPEAAVHSGAVTSLKFYFRLPSHCQYVRGELIFRKLHFRCRFRCRLHRLHVSRSHICEIKVAHSNKNLLVDGALVTCLGVFIIMIHAFDQQEFGIANDPFFQNRQMSQKNTLRIPRNCVLFISFIFVIRVE